MKLSEINAEELARDTVTEAFLRAQSILNAIDIGMMFVAEHDGEQFVAIDPAERSKRWQGTIVGHAAYCLTRYAQTGEPLDASVQEYCISLINAADEALEIGRAHV